MLKFNKGIYFAVVLAWLQTHEFSPGKINWQKLHPPYTSQLSQSRHKQPNSPVANQNSKKKKKMENF